MPVAVQALSLRLLMAPLEIHQMAMLLPKHCEELLARLSLILTVDLVSEAMLQACTPSRSFWATSCHSRASMPPLLKGGQLR